MASLPAAGSSETVGVYLETVYNGAGVDQAQAGLAKVEGEAKAATATAANLTSAHERAATSLKKLGTTAEEVGRSMSMYVSLPIIGIGLESAKMATKFQQSMEMLHTNAGSAQSSIAGLSTEVMKMSREVGAKPDELAQGLYHIASAGNGIWSTAKQLDILKIAAEGAAIGQANLDDTTYSLTSTMASNIKGAQDAAATMATLTSIVGVGDMRMQDLNAAIGTGFLGTAATFGISLRSVGAALATLTDNGEHADAAATRLRMTWALMAAPSAKAAELMEDLGISADGAQKATDQMNKVFSMTGLTTTKLATDLQQPNGMNVALKDLQTHLQKAGLTSQEADAMLSKMFGGGRTDAALLTLLQNLDRTDEKYKMISESSKDFSEKWNEQQKTANQQFHQAWAGIETDFIELGNTILPQVTHAMQDVSSAVTGVTHWYTDLSGGQRQFVIDAALVAAAIGPISLAFAGIIKVARSMITVYGVAADVATSKAAITAAAWVASGVKMAASFVTTAAQAVISATATALAWTADAVYASTIWAVQEMPKIVASFLWTSIKAAAYAADTALAWTLNAIRVSTEWTVTQLPRIVAGFATTSARAVLHAGVTSAAWIGSATKTGVMWTVTQLPRIVAGFVATATAATLRAGITAAVWVASATTTATAWVITQLPRIIAAFALTSAAATLQAARTSAAWVASAATSTRSFMAFRMLLASPVAMGAIGIAGALADIAAVYAAVQTVRGAINALNNAQNAIKIADKSDDAVHARLVNLSQHGTPQQKTDAQRALKAGLATGTNYAPGGWRWVGENGPEMMYVPRGAQVKTNTQSSSNGMSGGGSTQVSIGTIVLQNPATAREFFKQLNQDALNLGRGLTAIQGAY